MRNAAWIAYFTSINRNEAVVFFLHREWIGYQDNLQGISASESSETFAYSYIVSLDVYYLRFTSLI